MPIKKLSPKQKTVMNWWAVPKYRDFDAIICDGSVRSGKTLSMSLGFVLWASSSFNNGCFAICGKTVTSLKRNVITPLVNLLGSLGFVCTEKVSKNYIDITLDRRTNRFYYFGGKDEASASLIQGVTLYGILLDEVALMPRSFVEQALARCSIGGSKLWFNCNPENPYHWFYKEWIQKADEKKALYLHFTMEDNPSLSPSIRERYKRLYSGVFYERFILGKWTASTGLVYPLFKRNLHCVDSPPKCDRFFISCDYGTVNPSSFGLWGYCEGVWYRLAEYYYSSKEKGQLRTDEEHYQALVELAWGYPVEKVIVDPSAASFIECIKRHGDFSVVTAKNDVTQGIRKVSDALRERKILFCNSCEDTFREFSLYRWNEKLANDTPVKENDHAMDDIRYFVATVLYQQEIENFFVASVIR